jgi:hypothetical protein
MPAPMTTIRMTLLPDRGCEGYSTSVEAAWQRTVLAAIEEVRDVTGG